MDDSKILFVVTVNSIKLYDISTDPLKPILKKDFFESFDENTRFLKLDETTFLIYFQEYGSSYLKQLSIGAKIGFEALKMNLTFIRSIKDLKKVSKNSYDIAFIDT